MNRPSGLPEYLLAVARNPQMLEALKQARSSPADSNVTAEARHHMQAHGVSDADVQTLLTGSGKDITRRLYEQFPAGGAFTDEPVWIPIGGGTPVFSTEHETG